MEAYRTDAVVHEDGTIVIDHLPFRKGQRLEVILLRQDDFEGSMSPLNAHPLRGEPIRYVDPFGSVAEGDWQASG